MTMYTLTGTVVDSEGVKVTVGESTCSFARNSKNVEFYTSNGFKGHLTLKRKFADGKETSEVIKAG